MTDLKLFVCGHNAFDQFGSDFDDIIWKFVPLDLRKLMSLNSVTLKSFTDVKCGGSWFFNAFAIKKCLYVIGVIGKTYSTFVTHSFDCEIKELSVSESKSLILLDSGELYEFNADSDVLTEIKLFGLPSKILHVAAGATVMIATDEQHRIYEFATEKSLIGQLAPPSKVKKITCGREHTLILTTNGDVFSFGNGLRGQLGKDVLDSSNELSLLEALGGVKMLDIAAGAWCGFALSAFGDVYSWGWNVQGMMGQKVYEKATLKYADGRSEEIQQKCAAVFATPQLIEVLGSGGQADDATADDADGPEANELQIRKVFCGAKHTVLITTCGQILVAGWNEYGQLGLGDENIKLVDKFQAIDFQCDVDNMQVVCGHWSTILIVSP